VTTKWVVTAAPHINVKTGTRERVLY